MNAISVFCSLCRFAPAKPSWNAVIILAEGLSLWITASLLCASKGTNLFFWCTMSQTERGTVDTVFFKLQTNYFTFRRRLTFRSKLGMMCIHSTTIKEYVRIVIYLLQQKPAVDFQSSCVTRMCNISEILDSLLEWSTNSYFTPGSININQ